MFEEEFRAVVQAIEAIRRAVVGLQQDICAASGPGTEDSRDCRAA